MVKKVDEILENCMPDLSPLTPIEARLAPQRMPYTVTPDERNDLEKTQGGREYLAQCDEHARLQAMADCVREKTPVGRAYRAECEAIAKRQAEATAGKPLTDRGTFSVRIKSKHSAGEVSSEADTVAGGNKGEPLITMLGGTFTDTYGEYFELDVREVAGAKSPSYRATVQVITFDKDGKRCVDNENKILAVVGKPESLTVCKKDGDRLETRLEITEDAKVEKAVRH
jgi:hypothetical protein